MTVSSLLARNMRFIVLVTTDFLTESSSKSLEFDFSRVTIFGSIKFCYLGPQAGEWVGMIIPDYG